MYGMSAKRKCYGKYENVRRAQCNECFLYELTSPTANESEKLTVVPEKRNATHVFFKRNGNEFETNKKQQQKT